MYVIRDMKTIVTSKFGRVGLVADGTRLAPGLPIVTPSVIKAELISEYQTLEYNGYVQDSSGFSKGLIVTPNSDNPNRVDVLWDGVLANQLNIFAVLAQFRIRIPLRKRIKSADGKEEFTELTLNEPCFTHIETFFRNSEKDGAMAAFSVLISELSSPTVPLQAVQLMNYRDYKKAEVYLLDFLKSPGSTGGTL